MSKIAVGLRAAYDFHRLCAQYEVIPDMDGSGGDGWDEDKGEVVVEQEIGKVKVPGEDEAVSFSDEQDGAERIAQTQGVQKFVQKVPGEDGAEVQTSHNYGPQRVALTPGEGNLVKEVEEN